MENLMTIGEFAAASRLSQKALRLYGENGVLAPAWVDPDSGYRYYGSAQLRTATLIAMLRRAGVPLTEIRSFLRRPSVDWVERYERRAADEVAEQRRALRYVKRLLKEEAMFDVVTKDVREQRYVSKSGRVRVSELDAFIADGFAELGYEEASAPPFVLYHGAVTQDEDGPVDVCVPKPDGDERLPAGAVAATVIRGAQCQFPEILAAYEAVYGWAREHDRQPAGPPREIYVNGIDVPLELEIALPLR
jgi:DNA-binding transcriptional MerR regulator